MKFRIALIALALVAATPAYAGDLMTTLADRTGLSERQVQMLLGDRTAFGAYTISYRHTLAKFERALGKDVADKLIAGETVVLERRSEERVASLD